MAETKRSAGLPLDGRFRNVAFITTLGTNPGDDFIREGIRWFLGELLGRYNAIYVNKHDPRTLCVRAEEVPWRRWIAQRLGLPTGPARVPPAAQGASFDKLRESDLVVQCGGPFYWWTPLWRNYRPRFYRPPDSSCARASWRKAIWDERIAQVSGRVPVLNIGVGSSQPFHSRGEEVLTDASCRAFVRETYGMCRLTTTRDEVAHGILNALGLPNELLPCPSLFANDALGITPALPEFVALNFMPGGGHGQCGQALPVREWHQTFLALFRYLERRHPVVVVCHSLREWLALRDDIPTRALFYSDRFEDYLRLYAQCRAGILNRVHGALALASFGAPAILIGNDTRALAGRTLGMPVYFTNEITLPRLIQAFEHLTDRASEASQSLLAAKESARGRYLHLLKGALAERARPEAA